MFNGIIYNTGLIKIIKQNRNSKLIGVKTNLDFKRKSYKEENLSPQDILTLMFSFKNIGSYKSTNVLVSDKDKTDIDWEEIEIDEKLFEDIR